MVLRLVHRKEEADTVMPFYADQFYGEREINYMFIIRAVERVKSSFRISVFLTFLSLGCIRGKIMSGTGFQKKALHRRAGAFRMSGPQPIRTERAGLASGEAVSHFEVSVKFYLSSHFL